MNQHLVQLREQIAPVRQAILNHPLYANMQDLAQLQQFTQFHVYAVWDFMSLLKALQRNLTCVDIPWFPVGSAQTRYLINEIVVGEESDVNRHGTRMSHFELYLEAMENMGASTKGIRLFVQSLQQGLSLEESFVLAQTPEAARRFVRYTFELLAQNQPAVLAAVFTFGREDLIPDMFHALVARLSQEYPEALADFTYYLERHIEVDGDHHSHLALAMTEELCGNDLSLWQSATSAVTEALNCRKALWDGVYNSLQHQGVPA